MEMTEELPTDIQKLCRTCMNLLQEELTAQNCLFVEDTATDLAMQFTDITSLEVLLNMTLIRALFHLYYLSRFHQMMDYRILCAVSVRNICHMSLNLKNAV